MAEPDWWSIVVTSLVIDITTASGTATIDAGVAANGTTSSDTLIDGKTTATAAVISSIDDGGNAAPASPRRSSSPVRSPAPSARLPVWRTSYVPA